MKNKRNVEQQTRGWLPKGPSPSLPSNQKIKAATINRKIEAISARAMGGLGVGVFILGFFLLVGPYFLFPDLYTPKTSPAWGYTAPRTVEGWIFIVTALVLIFLSTFIFALYAMKLRSQGSKWMTHTRWITPRYTNDFGKKTYITAVVANVLMVATFLGVIAFTTAAAQNAQTTLSSIVIFTVLATVVNLLLYEYYKKKITDKSEGLQK